MRCVYIVTRIVKGERSGTAIPNLGAHTSRLKADRHFNSIIKDRLQFKCHVLWDHDYPTNPKERTQSVRQAYIEHPDQSSEELRLEKWLIG